jgi:hypothetical protein
MVNDEYWMVYDGDGEPINESRYSSYFDALEARNSYQNKRYWIKCLKEYEMPDSVADRLMSKVREEVEKSSFTEKTVLGENHISSPAHYTSGSIECIDAIRAALTPEEFRGFCKGNMLKYVWRERLKGERESILKAQWYAKRLADEGYP